MWRFRKSFSPLPGVRVTLSPSGLSTSIGVGPFRVTAGPRGQRLTTRFPGTGLSFQLPLSRQSGQGHNPRAKEPVSSNPPPATYREPEIQAIESAGSGVLTTAGLAEYKKLLVSAKNQHAEVVEELTTSRDAERLANDKYLRWKNGWLLRRIRKARFVILEEAAVEATARRAELEEQEALAKLDTHFEIPENLKSIFSRLSDAFAQMSRSSKLWDTVGHRAINQFVERSLAARAILRKQVKFRLGRCDIIQSDWDVPHLENANGGDLFLYPLFVLYFAGQQNFALLEYRDLEFNCGITQFHEEEAIPSDSSVVGKTWAKTNKDGSPDRRFKANYSIPIVAYGKLTFRSKTGLHEEYMVSNVDSCLAFCKEWSTLVQGIGRVIDESDLPEHNGNCEVLVPPPPEM